MKRLLTVLILCSMLLAVLPAMAAEQKSVAVSDLVAYSDGLFLVEIEDAERNYVYNEDGELVLKSPKNGVYIDTVLEMNEDGERMRRVFVDGKCAVIYTIDPETGKKKYGLIDNKGKVICSCKYDSISSFSDGLAAVRRGAKYGYINTSGELISKCQWDNAREFSGGLAVVKKSRTYSVINKKGAVIGSEFLTVQDQVDGYMAVQTAKGWGVINSKGRKVIKCKYSDVRLCGNGIAAVQDEKGNENTKYAFADMKGKLLTKFTFAEPTHSFSQDLMIVQYIDKEGATTLSALNSKGKRALNFKLDTNYEAGDYHSGVCMIRKIPQSYDVKKVTWGFVNKKAKWVIELKARTYEPAHNNAWLGGKLIKIQSVGDSKPKYGIMNTEGKIISKCKWDSISPFENGIAKVTKVEKSGKSGTATLVGYINTKGETVIPCKWKTSWVDEPQKNGLVLLSNEDGKFACYTNKGKEVLPATYDTIIIGERVLVAVKGDQMLYFDLKGQPLMAEETAAAAENAPEDSTQIPAETGEAA